MNNKLNNLLDSIDKNIVSPTELDYNKILEFADINGLSIEGEQNYKNRRSELFDLIKFPNDIANFVFDKINTMKIKTIDITAKEWFDKLNGNSYFSARVTINYGLKNEKTIYIPFEYGYGDSFLYQSLKELQELKLLDKSINSTQDLRENKIILRTHKMDKCLKREVIAFGKA